MDCRLETRAKEFAEQLVREHQAEFAAFGRLLELEELTCQIGDDMPRLLTEQELARRGRDLDGRSATRPDCGQARPCSACPTLFSTPGQLQRPSKGHRIGSD